MIKALSIRLLSSFLILASLGVGFGDAQNIQYPPTTAIQKAQTAALATGLVVKAAPGFLYSFQVSADSTLSGAAWWIMIFDAVSIPGDGSVTPAKCYAMASGVTSFAAGFAVPVNFATGITVVASTNGCFTKAASTHAFVSGDFQ